MVKTSKTKLLAMLMAVVMVFAMAPLMGAQKAYAIADSGTLGMNLANQSYYFPSETDAVKLGLCLGTLAHNGYINITKQNVGETSATISYDVNFDGTADMYCTTAYNANYRPKSSTVGMTNSCTAQGVKGFSVTKEQVEEYIAIMPEGAYADSDSYYSRLELDFGGSVIEEPKPKLVNKGGITLDLAKGPATLKGTELEFNALLYPLEYLIIIGQINFKSDKNQEGLYYLDLDKDGTWDITIAAIDPDDSGSAEGIMTFTKLDTCSIKKSITKTLDSDMVADLAETNVSEELDSFYSSVTFIFAKAAPAKKVNTLTLQAKKAKAIKAKKLKKKAQTVAISKYLTVSKAQGTVTYAKASGSKKITIAKNGTVTIKKKTKKGSYKVKVNVTAAGNVAYNKMTKAVVVTIKVK